MPDTITRRPAPNYPITRLSNGLLTNRDPGAVNTPIYNASVSNGGMKLRIYDPASNTTHAIFNNGNTADFDRHGRLMDRAGVQNARNINHMNYEATTGTTPYSAPRPAPPSVSRPSTPAPLPPPQAARSNIRRQTPIPGTSIKRVQFTNGYIGYFDGARELSDQEVHELGARLAGAPAPDPEVDPRTGSFTPVTNRGLIGNIQANFAPSVESAKINAPKVGKQILSDLGAISMANDPMMMYGPLVTGHENVTVQRMDSGASAMKRQAWNMIGGQQGMVAHGVQAAQGGRFLEWAKTVPHGISMETQTNPFGQIMNVVALVSTGRMTLSMGAGGMAALSDDLAAQAVEANAKGEPSLAAKLYEASNQARGAAEHMQSTANAIHRGVTVGPIGDYVRGSMRQLADNLAPGSAIAKALEENYVRGKYGTQLPLRADSGIKPNQPGDIYLPQNDRSLVPKRTDYTSKAPQLMAPALVAPPTGNPSTKLLASSSYPEDLRLPPSLLFSDSQNLPFSQGSPDPTNLYNFPPLMRNGSGSDPSGLQGGLGGGGGLRLGTDTLLQEAMPTQSAAWSVLDTLFFPHLVVAPSNPSQGVVAASDSQAPVTSPTVDLQAPTSVAPSPPLANMEASTSHSSPQDGITSPPLKAPNAVTEQARGAPQELSRSGEQAISPSITSPPILSSPPSAPEAPANAGASFDSGVDTSSSDNIASVSSQAGDPPTRLERLEQEFGVNTGALRDDILAELDRRRTHANTSDPDNSQLIDKAAKYGALKIAANNGSIRFPDWQNEMVSEIRDWIKPNLKQLWDASMAKYQAADHGQLSLRTPDEVRHALVASRSDEEDGRFDDDWEDDDDNRPPQYPSVYSTWFEGVLRDRDFGRSRDVHFNRMNKELHRYLLANPEFATIMEEISPGITERVSARGGRQVPEGFTWEHASSTTASGRLGVMRLVPRRQHTPGSRWWRLLHPDTGAVGGYNEWGIPFGAPPN